MVQMSTKVVGIHHSLMPFENVIWNKTSIKPIQRLLIFQIIIVSGNKDIVQVLINAGANVNASNGNRETPIFTAARWGNFVN